MMADFKTLLLLLSTALGLSLLIERLLEAVKRLIKMFLFSGTTPFRELYARPIEAVLFTIGTRRLNDLLDEHTEEKEELLLQLQNPESQDRAMLQRRLRQVEKEIRKYHSQLSALIHDRLQSDVSLTRPEREELKKKEQELNGLQEGTSDLKNRTEVSEEYRDPVVLLDPLSSPDAEKTVRIFWVQLIGTLAGVILCYFSRFGLFEHLLPDLFSSLPVLDYILTGILIGGGSQPIHTLIRFITDRKLAEMKVSLEASVGREETIRAQVPGEGEARAGEKKPAGLTPGIGDTLSIYPVDVPYSGGIDREELEFRHRRSKNPEMIIYHHTAMHSETSFDDLVKVIKDRGWITGYHCVILKDGSIRPFCRWDRYGNHARGHNRHSLGLAFHGNFEPDPGVACANVNGRLGLLHPTDEQLLAASRVVALWCFLYDISPEFDKTILPHRNLAPKACPGSNFPFETFQHLIVRVYEAWKHSSAARERIALFKQKQYVYV